MSSTRTVSHSGGSRVPQRGDRVDGLLLGGSATSWCRSQASRHRLLWCFLVHVRRPRPQGVGPGEPCAGAGTAVWMCRPVHDARDDRVRDGVRIEIGVQRVVRGVSVEPDLEIIGLTFGTDENASIEPAESSLHFDGQPPIFRSGSSARQRRSWCVYAYMHASIFAGADSAETYHAGNVAHAGESCATTARNRVPLCLEVRLASTSVGVRQSRGRTYGGSGRDLGARGDGMRRMAMTDATMEIAKKGVVNQSAGTHCKTAGLRS